MSANLFPDTNNPIVKFNFYYAFDYIPNCIKLFNEGKNNIMSVIDVIKINALHPEFSKISPKIEFWLSENKNDSSCKGLIISIPNTKSISETELAYIIFDESLSKAYYYTLEFTIGGEYMIGTPKVGVHTTIMSVRNVEEFIEEASNDAMSRLNEIKFEDNSRSEISNNEFLTEENEYFNQEVELFEKEEEKFKELFKIINFEVNWRESTDNFPKDERGKAETHIYFASLVPDHIPVADLAQALHENLEELQILEIEAIEKKIEQYKKYYKSLVTKPFIIKKWSLVDFAREFGRMKVTNVMENNKTGEKFKSGAFQDINDKLTLAGFHGFAWEQQTPAFISKHKDKIGVLYSEFGNYKIYFIDQLKRDKYKYFQSVIQSLFLYPIEKEFPMYKEAFDFEWDGILELDKVETVIENMKEVSEEIKEEFENDSRLLNIKNTYYFNRED